MVVELPATDVVDVELTAAVVVVVLEAEVVIVETGATAVVVLELEAAVVALLVEVETCAVEVVDDTTEVVVEDEEDETTAPNWYTLMALGPPQYSEPLPLHIMLHPLAIGEDLALIEFPQSVGRQ